MNIYKFIELENEDILLQKIIIDNTKYNIINNENGDILLKKIKSIKLNNINNLNLYNFKFSNILNCSINNIKYNKKLKYKTLLNTIYKILNDGTLIIKNTLLNIKTIIKLDEGFYYLDDLGISIQSVDSQKCLFEIINQCTKNNIKIFMKVKLNDNSIIEIDF